MKTIVLGDIIREIVEKTTINNQHPVLTSSQSGLVSQGEYFNKQIASQDNTGYKIIRQGQFTYRAMSDTGRFYINQSPYEIGIVSPAYPVFEIIGGDSVLAEYIAAYFKSESFQNAIALKSTGSTRVSLKLNKIKALQTEVPSITRQKEILDTLSRMELLIASRQEQLVKLDELVKSRFIELFGDPLLDDGRYPKVPLSTLTEVGSSKRIFEKEYVSEGVPFYRTKEIVELSKGNRITTELFISRDRYDEIRNEYGVPKNGDLLISAVGTIGVIWVVDGKNDFYFKDGNLLRVAATDKFAPTYIKHLLEALIGAYKQEMSSGTAYAALTISALKEMMVYEVPITEQEQFAAFVEQTDKSKLAVQKGLQELEILKKSLMQEYFG